MIAHWKGNIFQLRTPTHYMTLAKSTPSFVPPASFQAKADWIDWYVQSLYTQQDTQAFVISVVVHQDAQV